MIDDDILQDEFFAAATAEYFPLLSWEDMMEVQRASDAALRRRGISTTSARKWDAKAGFRLMNLVIEAGWSAHSIAEKLQCTTDAVQFLYAGTANGRRVQQICDLINANLDYVYTGSGQDWKTGGPTAP
jgi:hypothetical protein